MTWLDYAVLGVIGASVVWGMWRGLVREIVSVVGWVMAFLAANLFAGPLSLHMPTSIPTPELRLLAAFAALFIGTLAVATLLGLLLAKIIRVIGLGGLDRTLGSLFGLIRGLLIVMAFALLAGLTSMPQKDFWRDSVSGELLARGAQALKPWLPQTFVGGLRYD